MSVTRKELPMNLAGRMRLQIHHFAKGTYPVKYQKGSVPFNRFFIPLSNPSGRANVMTDRGNHYVLTPGNVYFIPLNYPVYMSLDEKLVFISIQFTLELYDGVDLFSCYGRAREISDPKWRRMAVGAYRNSNEFESALELHSLVMDFSKYLASDMSPSEWEYVTRFSEFQPELDFIQSGKASLASISVQELADVRGLSRESFSRKFKKTTGTSPKEFLNRLILKRACHLLIHGNGSLKEIAEELGFSSEFYFSRFFRKHTSQPPNRYRISCGKKGI